MKLIALKKIGRTQPGQTFEVKDAHARAFLALKLARPADDQAAVAVEPSEVAITLESDSVPTRRRYQRRDLTATS